VMCVTNLSGRKKGLRKFVRSVIKDKMKGIKILIGKTQPKKYKVTFWIEHQGFTLDHKGTRKDMEWLKKMLLIAFKRYEKIIQSNLDPSQLKRILKDKNFV